MRPTLCEAVKREINHKLPTTFSTMPLFGKSQKSPAELVKALKEAVNSLERGDKKAEKAQEDVSKNLVSTID